jgi:hypothetical protein
VLFLPNKTKSNTMSAIKNFYHDQISNHLSNHQDDLADADFQFAQWEEDQEIEKRAEEAAFFRIFELSGSYPM